VLLCAAPSDAQTTAVLQGRVFDPSGALLPGAAIDVRDDSTRFDVPVQSDREGRYSVSALPVGNPSSLPPGSNIQFRVPAAWELYRWYIVGTLVLIAAQFVLIAGLLLQRARRLRAGGAVRRNEASLRTSYERNRHLAGRLINAQEAARAQIARDLHDDVCQELVGLSLAVNRLQRSSGRIQDTRTQNALSGLNEQVLAVVDGVRRLSHDLHPAGLRLVGLAGALESHCIEVERRHDVQVGFRREGDLEHVHPDVAMCVFRVVQEALRNGAVHGGARRLAVSIARSRDDIELTVSDDGCGFDLEAVRRAGSGLGLVSMEERAHLVGGDVHVVTRPQHGTTVSVRVPAGASITADGEPGSGIRGPGTGIRSPGQSRSPIPGAA
jgi:signal transduction histidine kinase